MREGAFEITKNNEPLVSKIDDRFDFNYVIFDSIKSFGMKMT